MLSGILPKCAYVQAVYPSENKGSQPTMLRNVKRSVPAPSGGFVA